MRSRVPERSGPISRSMACRRPSTRHLASSIAKATAWTQLGRLVQPEPRRVPRNRRRVRVGQNHRRSDPDGTGASNRRPDPAWTGLWCRSRRTRPHAARERGRSQMVFQDPITASLDPRQRVEDGLDEIQRLHFRRPAEARARRSAGTRRGGRPEPAGRSCRPAALRADSASGSRSHARWRPSPRSDSGRGGIRSGCLDPGADPESARRPAGTTGLPTYIVISHDLAVVRHVAEECLVHVQGQRSSRAAT